LRLRSRGLRGQYDPAIVFEWIRERRVDGLIIAKSQRRERPLLREALASQLPIVTVAPDEAVTHVHIVKCDNLAGGVAVANHLAAPRHRRVGVAGGPRPSLASRRGVRGSRDGLARQGIRLRPKAIPGGGSSEADAGAAFASRWLDGRPPVTALVMGNDALALGFMRVAQQRGV